jgi:hypothetical protein
MGRGKCPNALRAKGVEKEEENMKHLIRIPCLSVCLPIHNIQNETKLFNTYLWAIKIGGILTYLLVLFVPTGT